MCSNKKMGAKWCDLFSCSPGKRRMMMMSSGERSISDQRYRNCTQRRGEKDGAAQKESSEDNDYPDTELCSGIGSVRQQVKARDIRPACKNLEMGERIPRILHPTCHDRLPAGRGIDPRCRVCILHDGNQ